MNASDKISRRRLELGFSDTEVSKAIGVGIDAYYDIEAYPDEIIDSVDIVAVKKLCSLLNFSIFDLLNFNCSFCKKASSFENDYRLPRNLLVKNKRKALGLSISELADKIGFEDQAVVEIESDSEYLEHWTFCLVKILSQTLDLPIQILLGTKCSKCGL